MQVATTALLGLVLFLTPWTGAVVLGVSLPAVAQGLIALFLAGAVALPTGRLCGSSRVWQVAVLFAVVVAVQGALVDNGDAYSAAKQLVLSLLVFASLVVVGLGREQWRVVTACLTGGCLVAIALGAMGMQDVTPQGADVTLRASVEGINTNHIAYCCVAAISMLLGGWVTSADSSGRNTVWQTVYVVFLVGVLCLGIAMCATRGAIIGVAGMFCVLTVRGVIKKQLAVCFWMLALFLIAVAALALAPSFLTRFQEMHDTRRLEAWTAAWDLFLEAPLVGVGPGQFPTASGLGIFPHNGVLGILAEGGLIGLSLYLGIMVMVFSGRVPGNYAWARALIGCGLLPVVLTGVWERNVVLFSVLALVQSDFGRTRTPRVGLRARLAIGRRNRALHARKGYRVYG